MVMVCMQSLRICTLKKKKDKKKNVQHFFIVQVVRHSTTISQNQKLQKEKKLWDEHSLEGLAKLRRFLNNF